MKTKMIFFLFFVVSCRPVDQSTQELPSLPFSAREEVIVDTFSVYWINDDLVMLQFLFFDTLGRKDRYKYLDEPSLNGVRKAIEAGLNFSPRHVLSWEIYMQRGQNKKFGLFLNLEPELDTPATLVWQNSPSPDTIFLPEGGSLNKTLQMSNAEALEFAKRFKKKHWRDEEGRLFVIVQPGYYVHDWHPIGD